MKEAKHLRYQSIQDVISGIVGIVSDLGNAIARLLSNILPQPGRN